MNKLLYNLAVDKIWQDIFQDRIHNLQPARLSDPIKGVYKTITLPYNKLNLPDTDSKWHVFQVGYLPPYYMDVPVRDKTWMLPKWRRLDASCTDSNVYVSVYDSMGIRASYQDVYHIWTRDGNFIIAVRDNDKVPLDYRGNIYVKFYSNVYFKSVRANDLTDGIVIVSDTPRTNEDILRLQGEYVKYFNYTKGHVTCYVNGQIVKNISLETTSIKDAVDIVYDSSVRYVLDFNLATTYRYTSQDTKEYRYLLHRTKDTDNTIYYRDDIEIQLVHKVPYGTDMVVDKGLYIPNDDENTLRMVTYRDYGLDSRVIPNIYNKIGLLTGNTISESNTYIRILLREDGWNRKMCLDQYRQLELYKLEDQDILKALAGVNGPSMWRADVLELSPFTKLMASKLQDMTDKLVVDTFGYNAITKYTSDAVIDTYTYGAVQAARLSIPLQANSTIYEYDADGLLLGWYNYSGDSTYTCHNANCVRIEAIRGRGTDTPTHIYSTGPIDIDPRYNTRVYLGDIINASEGYFDNWVDITDQTELYTIVDNRVVPTNINVPSGKILQVRQDDSFLVYDTEIMEYNGVLYTKIPVNEDRGLGIDTYYLDLPKGELDVFLNGKLLIENLDYNEYNGTIVINNEEYLAGDPKTTAQKIHIRYRGFCNKDFSRTLYRDAGFIVEGKLSRNAVFNVRDDRVVHVSVDGQMYALDEVPFEEDNNPPLPDAFNGRPYQITDIMVPFKDFIPYKDTYLLRDESRKIDQAVSDYLTLKAGASSGGVYPITAKYVITSPTIKAIIDAVYRKEIDIYTIDTKLTTQELNAIIKPYLDTWWIHDPLNPDIKIDERFVEIRPHNNSGMIPLTSVMYNFIDQVITYLSKGEIVTENYYLVAGI